MIKIQSGYEREAIAGIKDLYNKFNPGLPLDFTFLDQEYQALYNSEQRVATLSKYFAGVAIVISCLGLLGLAIFAAERRVKEIGIRKTLGATELNIVSMLTGDFTRLVVIAILIAMPVSYLLARQWVERFAYRIDLEWWYFVGSGLMALLISWLTIGAQAIRSTRINPGICLRNE
jgi:ABC-type antimicrobial peptide transport system permease subunit